MPTHKRSIYFAGLLLICALFFAEAGLGADITKVFDIPASPAHRGLNLFAQQADIQILYPYDQVKDLQINRLQGEYTLEEGMRKLIDGTCLQLSEHTERAMTLDIEDDNRGFWFMKRNAIDCTKRGVFSTLATAFVTAITAAPVLGQEQDSADEQRRESIEEIIVTGTLIRGIAPAGVNTISMSEEQILATGRIGTVDLLRELPQMGAFQGVGDIGTSTNIHFTVNRPNIRNLPGDQQAGGSTTLLLVDGRRMVNAGILQTAPDPDMVPPGIIERIEIMPDGGSATYGSDAVGGVINIVTRRHFSGFELDARYGLGDSYHTFDANMTAGREWGSGSAYISYSYAEQDDIFGRDRGYIRKWGVGESANPDRTCHPGNVVIGNIFYAAPGLEPNTSNNCDTSQDNAWWPKQERHSVFGSLSHSPTDSILLNVQAYYTERDTTYTNGPFRTTSTIRDSNPFYRRTADNPAPEPALPQSISFSWEPVFGNSSSVNRTTMESWGITPTATFDLTPSWQARAMLNYGRSQTEINNDVLNETLVNAALVASSPDTAIDPYDLNNTPNQQLFTEMANWKTHGLGKQELINPRLILDGPVLDLPGGSLSVAIGAEFMKDIYKARYQLGGVAPGNEASLPYSRSSREIASAFAEIAVPIVGPANAVRGIQSLDLSLAGRYDDYSDVGDTFNPKIGLTYEPFDGLRIRANWGESFNAPSQADLAGITSFFNAPALLVSSPFPGEFSPEQANHRLLAVSGANPNLLPQTATTYGIGADIQPKFLPGFNASITYYNIDFKDLLGSPPLNNPTLFYGSYTDYYTFDPTQEQVEALFSQFAGGLEAISGTFDPGALPVYALIDGRRQNLGRTKLDGIDFFASQVWTTTFGSVDWSINGNYELSRKSQPLVGLEWRDDLSADIPRFRFSTTAGLNMENIRIQATLKHSHGFDVTPTPANNFQSSISSFNVVDLHLRYDTPSFGTAGAWSLLDDLSITLNINNLFDTDPPRYKGSFSSTSFHGYGNGLTVGRLFQLGVRKRF